MNCKIVPIEELFDIRSGITKYIRRFGQEHLGEYPVWAASNTAPLIYINRFDYEGEFLTWAIKGLAGYVKILSKQFSINSDRGILIPKRKDIDIYYVKYVLEPILREKAVGRRGENNENEFSKFYSGMMKNIQIPLPIDRQGNYCLPTQQAISKKFLIIEELKAQIKKHINDLDRVHILLTTRSALVDVPLIELFDLYKGKSEYTNAYVLQNQGEFPLYSSQTTNEGILGNINTYDFDVQQALTWTTDGAYAGTVFLRTGKFSMTTHCGVMLLKHQLQSQIYLPYIYQVCRHILPREAHGQENKRLTIKMIRSIKLPIPIDSEGNFNYQKQQTIANKYELLNQIKNGIHEQLTRVRITQVTL